jgi:hypothetical protein
VTEIVIRLIPDSGGQPAGTLRSGPRPEIRFTGWLELIRLLEAEVAARDDVAAAKPAAE